jgi:hypothetical protein
MDECKVCMEKGFLSLGAFKTTLELLITKTFFYGVGASSIPLGSSMMLAILNAFSKHLNESNTY